jgi:endoglucanase
VCHTAAPPTIRAVRRALLLLLLLLLVAALFALGSQARPAANPFAGATLFVDPRGAAAKQVRAWRQTNPAAAKQIAKIAAEPQADWFTMAEDVDGRMQRRVAEIANAEAMAVFVFYFIVHRDCGLYSTGGAPSAAAYRRWIDAAAQAIGDRRTAVVLEPDALASIGAGALESGRECLTAARVKERLGLFRHAVQRLEGLPRTSVYIDAGHSDWRQVEEIAGLLRRAGVAAAHGFALNVSNFQTSADTVAYGRQISRLVGGKHFVVDTSRNGRGPLPERLWKKPEDAWCNSPGRALGDRPTTRTADALVDAYLWIKIPGESDGACNGGPPPGVWWPQYALGLARRAAY